MKIRRTPEGMAYLNIGCGLTYFKEWTNIDLFKNECVDYYDIPLPYPANSFNAVYSSHILEHFVPDEGRKIISEIYRVLKKGGMCRVVVPDLEKICLEYLKCLDRCVFKPSKNNIQKYNWIKLILIDQMVREKPGGLMLDILQSGNIDLEYVKYTCGDQLYRGHQVYNFLKNRIPKGELASKKDPKKSGEIHKWMYDRVSLKILMKECGFVDFSLKSFDKSEIKYWGKYNLDKSIYGDYPRRPFSIYAECKKLFVR